MPYRLWPSPSPESTCSARELSRPLDAGPDFNLRTSAFEAAGVSCGARGTERGGRLAEKLDSYTWFSRVEQASRGSI
jgi:hypothetical protein